MTGLDPAIIGQAVHSIRGFYLWHFNMDRRMKPGGDEEGERIPVTRIATCRQRNARDIGALYLGAEDAENDVSVGNVVREDTILETEDLTKEFAGFVAVRGVSLRVRRGSIHALIGPNGAGKTTCFNLLTKFMAPTRGRIVFDGRDITALKPADVAQLGLGRSFQISAVFPHLTVLENVRIALQRRRGASFDFWRSKRILRALDDRAQALIADVGLSPYAKALAVELPYGRKRALEIATTLALDPELMLLDEPMAGMGREDIARISALIKSAAATRTVLMVEHNLSVVSDLCDCITVLTRGQVLAEGDYKTVSANPAVREAYLGTGHS
jgi:branched-chain amino acid transport system ATP-binding protein